MADDLLRDTSTGQGGETVKKIFLAVEELLALVHLHRVAERSGSSRNDRDFLNRGGIALRGGHHSVSDLVVGDDLFLLG